MSCNIYNPTIPYVGPISGIISPGFVINIKGSSHPSCTRFGINLQCGPNISPRDDVSLHIGVDFTRGCVVRNSIHNMNWGPEEMQGHFPFVRGAPFEIVIRCEPTHYNITINGQHFTTFEHRIVYHRTTHLALDGDILIGSIEYQSESHNPPSYGLYPSVPNTPHYGNSAPYPPSPNMPYPPSPNMPYPQNTYPATHGQTPYGPTPMMATMHGTQHPYMPHSPNAPHQTHKPGMVDGLLKKVGVGGGAAATTAVLASTAGLGMLGGKKAWKSQKKARKKALKYGIPLAGAGLGAYAISRAFHSSSSSSSSSDEE